MTEKTIKELCEAYGISQTELHRRFDIPLRTVQDWYAGRRKPPAYVVNMLTDLLESTEKNIYVIYWDNPDDSCSIKGYIHGTEEEADRYCDELNKGNKYEYEDYTWERLDNLTEHDRRPTP